MVVALAVVIRFKGGFSGSLNPIGNGRANYPAIDYYLFIRVWRNKVPRIDGGPCICALYANFPLKGSPISNALTCMKIYPNKQKWQFCQGDRYFWLFCCMSNLYI